MQKKISIVFIIAGLAAYLTLLEVLAETREGKRYTGDADILEPFLFTAREPTVTNELMLSGNPAVTAIIGNVELRERRISALHGTYQFPAGEPNRVVDIRVQDDARKGLPGLHIAATGNASFTVEGLSLVPWARYHIVVVLERQPNGPTSLALTASYP